MSASPTSVHHVSSTCRSYRVVVRYTSVFLRTMSGRNRDIHWMTHALTLAARGRGRTRPNPMVGAVIVDPRGRLVAEGYHRKAGTAHAEAIALRKAGTRARGATLYVNLEPCCHTEKRTPPCTDAILEAGIRRVVVGMQDPNPRVSGRGIRKLRAGGLEVRTGVLRGDCRRLNAAFVKHIITGRPLVTVKIASTLDGKIATRSGESRWITGPRARREVHELRADADGIMVGTETVLRDDPSLTCRTRGGTNPIRIIPDRRGRIALTSRIFTDGAAPTWIAATRNLADRRRRILEKRGVRIITVPSAPNGIDLRRLVDVLGKEGILHLMIEGGARLAAEALRTKIADRLWWFTAPRIIGGDGRSAVAPLALPGLGASPVLVKPEVLHLGPDLLIRGDITYPETG